MKYNFSSSILLLILIFSFSGNVQADFFEKDKDIIWKIGLNQYIKFGKQDTVKYGGNEHPVELDEKEIFYTLKALQYEEKSFLSGTETLKAVFTSLQTKVLSQSLAKGLRNAKPDQDIIFVLEKAESKMLGLKEKSFNAGRIFYKDGKLNIIMGEYEFFRSEAFEKQYDPGGQSGVPYNFHFGKRTRKTRIFQDVHFKATGVNIKAINGERRSDWLVMDVSVASKAYIADEIYKQNPVTAGDKKLEAETAKLAKQRREMRSEMARMRKQVQDISNKEELVSVKSIEERMAMLDQLLGKKLITQEEYDSKRKEILNDI
jgi:hypothetical protein